MLCCIHSSSSFSDELNSNEISNLSLSIDLREYRRVSELAGQQVEVSINAVNSVGGGNYSNSLTYAVPGISSSPGTCAVRITVCNMFLLIIR